MLGENWYRYVPGAIVALVGVGYGALEFIPSIEPPANMRFVRRRLPSCDRAKNMSRDAADAGWGAEQV
jgi:hypothetical protein